MFQSNRTAGSSDPRFPIFTHHSKSLPGSKTPVDSCCGVPFSYIKDFVVLWCQVNMYCINGRKTISI